MRSLNKYRILMNRLRSSGLRKSVEEIGELYSMVKMAQDPLNELAKLDTSEHVGKDDAEIVFQHGDCVITVGTIRRASNILGYAPGSALERSESAK